MEKNDHNLGLAIIMKPVETFGVDFYDGANFGDILVYKYLNGPTCNQIWAYSLSVWEAT